MRIFLWGVVIWNGRCLGMRELKYSIKEQNLILLYVVRITKDRIIVCRLAIRYRVLLCKCEKHNLANYILLYNTGHHEKAASGSTPGKYASALRRERP